MIYNCIDIENHTIQAGGAAPVSIAIKFKISVDKENKAQRLRSESTQ